MVADVEPFLQAVCEQTLWFFSSCLFDLRWAFSSHQQLHIHTCWELWGVQGSRDNRTSPTGLSDSSVCPPLPSTPFEAPPSSSKAPPHFVKSLPST